MSSVDDAKNRILSQVPLGDLIGDRISPQRRSGRIVGLCPFHNEKTPSFYIYDDNYFCFGCKASGDAITYVRQTQGLGYIDSLKWLAKKYGIEAPELEGSKRDKQNWQKNQRKSQIFSAAQNFFVKHLSTPEGERAKNYLKSRGYSDEHIVEFGFGYAPKSANSLVRQLKALGFKFDEIKECSLSNGTEQRSFDFFQDRVMIPIRDLHGRLVAFGGRSLGDEMPKYKNSRYDKAYILFGMDTARKAMREKARAIVVEGYMDALQLWNYGFKEAVACQGTAFTIHHMRSIQNATGTVYMLFDGDSAGQNANLKSINDAMELPDLEFKVAVLPKDEDPDSFVRKNGADALNELLGKAEDLVGYAISQKLKSAPINSISETISKELLPWVNQTQDPIKKDLLLNKIAQKSGVSVNSLRLQISQKHTTKPQRAHSATQLAEEMPHKPSKASPISPLGKELLGQLFYAHPNDIDFEKLNEYITKNFNEDELWQNFANELLTSLQNQKIPSELTNDAWLSANAPQIEKLILELKDSCKAFEADDRRERINKIILTHRQKQIKETVRYLKNKMISSDMQKDEQQDEWLQIMQAISSLNKELDNIQSNLE